MTIEKRGPSYRSTVYKNGKRYRKTFSTKKLALQWKLAMQLADDVKSLEGQGKTFGALLQKYRNEVLPLKKSQSRDIYTINRFLRNPIADVMVANITKETFEQYFRQQAITTTRYGKQPSFSTLNSYKTLLSSCVKYGIALKWLETNPVRDIKIPKDYRYRKRVATPEEIQLLCDTVGWDNVSPPRNFKQRLIASFVFSTLTGMRHGEIAQLKPEWIHERYIKLPATATKTSVGRNIALSKKAVNLLNQVLSLNLEENVFGLHPGKNYDSVAFIKIRNQAGLHKITNEKGDIIQEGLNLHDGRTTFAVWAASARQNGAPHLDPITLARQLGYSDVKMTMRYYRSTPEQVADMLDFED